MPPSQNNQGIQTLLDAEKEAAAVVTAAREYRTQKLKQARADADKEIDAIKSQEERSFLQFESEQSKLTEQSQSEVNIYTTKQLEIMNEQYEKNKDAVIEKLLDRVVQIDNKLHQNLTKQ